MSSAHQPNALQLLLPKGQLPLLSLRFLLYLLCCYSSNLTPREPDYRRNNPEKSSKSWKQLMQMKDQQVRGGEALLPAILAHLPWRARHSPHSKLWEWHHHLVKPPHLGQYSPNILAWRKWWKTSTGNKEAAESTERMTGARKQIIHMLDLFSESRGENSLGKRALV